MYKGLIIFGIKIPQDKIMHFIVGAFISLLVYSITNSSIISSLSIALAAGIAKELYDAYVSKNWDRLDVLDIIATFVGGGAGIILIEVLKLIH
jgi:hypothetical protein